MFVELPASLWSVAGQPPEHHSRQSVKISDRHSASCMFESDFAVHTVLSNLPRCQVIITSLILPVSCVDSQNAFSSNTVGVTTTSHHHGANVHSGRSHPYHGQRLHHLGHIAILDRPKHHSDSSPHRHSDLRNYQRSSVKCGITDIRDTVERQLCTRLNS